MTSVAAMEDIERTLGEENAIRRVRGSMRSAPQLYVLLHADEPRLLSSRHSLQGVTHVHLGRGQQREAVRNVASGKTELSLLLPDRRASSQHASITREGAKFWLQDNGSRNGTRVNGVAITRHELRDEDVVELGHTALLFRVNVAQRADVEADYDAAADSSIPRQLRTLSGELSTLLQQVCDLAESPISILLEGATGTGKEVVARHVSALSGRSGEFVGVNCGALPESLVESELFGYVRGAFSGATQDRPGLVRSAHNGTLFLDEIGDLPPPSQAALLRVLQEREVRPVGGTRAVPVNIRLISATHRDLDQLVDQERFREDLFARIASYRARLPSLHQRKEDLGILIGNLLEKMAPEREIRLSLDAVRALYRYNWPLNVRELENALATALQLAKEDLIFVEHLPEQIRSFRPGRQAESPTSTVPKALTDEQLEHKRRVAGWLQEHKGNVSAIARHTGKARSQIQRWLRRYQLNPEDYR